MSWNWQQPDWPEFRHQPDVLAPFEASFLRQGGVLIGTFRHLQPADGGEITAEILTSEAITTSAIEGEILDRESVRSSILRHLGLGTAPRRVGPSERGISALATDVLRTWEAELSSDSLFGWHRMIMEGRADLPVGAYRTHEDPMQIVSGPIGKQTIHFEAPPSQRVPGEMARYVEWFNGTRSTLPALTRAGIGHLYFESVHPFEDGNGRMGRALAEKALAQGLGQASLTMLSTEIESRRAEYYAKLEAAGRSNDITAWLVWFAEVILAAQGRTQAWIDFLIAKTKLLDGLRGRVNQRQEKAILRITREGPAGFTGGLSAGNYQRITGASPATAGRDLAELVELGALRRTGEGRGTRYWLVQG